MRAIFKIWFLSLPIFSISSTSAQIISIGENSTLSLGDKSSFFAGGNTTFRGTLSNNGNIISYSNIDFVNNKSVGNLQLVGVDQQEVVGGDLFVDQLEVNSSSTVILKANELQVDGNFNVVNGVISTEELGSLIVRGDFVPSGGFIEGTLTGFTKNGAVTFPMGVDRFANYISISSTTADIETIITCQVPPDVSQLLPTEEMVGIADEVEWILQTTGESTEVRISVDFSGLDFINFSNGEAINADVYEPALVVFQDGDTLYHLLQSVESSPQNGASNLTEGKIVSETKVVIGPEPTKISVAWIPIVDDPEFYVPNVFSPTGFYQENRVFRPFFSGGQVSSISIAVYNSFNKRIYEYEDSGEDLDLSLIGWDGKVAGLEAEEGVYYYSVKLIADGVLYQKTSAVLLTN